MQLFVAWFFSRIGFKNVIIVAPNKEVCDSFMRTGVITESNESIKHGHPRVRIPDELTDVNHHAIYVIDEADYSYSK